MRGGDGRFTITYVFLSKACDLLSINDYSVFIRKREKKTHINEEVYIIQYELQLLEEYKK